MEVTFDFCVDDIELFVRERASQTAAARGIQIAC
jgi:hypothetical protein